MLLKKKEREYMKKRKNKLPDFDKMSYEEEAKWWDTHDLGDYWDEFKDVNIVFELNKPKDATLIIRLQKGLKDKLDRLAKNKGLKASSLARMLLIEKLKTA